MDMNDLYTNKMKPETIKQIYQGIQNAFYSIDDNFIDTPKVKGKIVNDYLIIEYVGFDAYIVYDNRYENHFQNIKQDIIDNKKIHDTYIFQHIPMNKVFDFIGMHEKPISPESREFAKSWIYTYSNYTYNLGLGSTISLFKLHQFLNNLSDNGFMSKIDDKKIENWSPINIYGLDISTKQINKIFKVATEKKYVFNDEDNTIYLKNNGLVIQTQSYGYYIKKEKNTLTAYVYAENSKKHNNINKLIKDVENNTQSVSLIDNVGLKIVDGKVVFSDALFSVRNFYEDMEIASNELKNMKPTKPKIKPKM